MPRFTYIDHTPCTILRGNKGATDGRCPRGRRRKRWMDSTLLSVTNDTEAIRLTSTTTTGPTAETTRSAHGLSARGNWSVTADVYSPRRYTWQTADRQQRNRHLKTTTDRLWWLAALGMGFTLCHPGLTYIFNFWHSGTLALRTERQSARMSKIKNGGLDQYGAEPFKQHFGTAGFEEVKTALQLPNEFRKHSLTDKIRAYP